MARQRKGFTCTGCGAPLSSDEQGPDCAACSRPAVARARRTVRAYARDRVGESPAALTGEHGPRLCEDAPACAVCRERMGLSPTLPGLG